MDKMGELECEYLCVCVCVCVGGGGGGGGLPKCYRFTDDFHTLIVVLHN